MRRLFARIRDSIVLNGVVVGSRVAFGLAGIFSERFRRAVDGFEAVYRFSAGGGARCLVFSGGRIRIRGGGAAPPDYELVLLDPAGFLRSMRKDPNDTLRLLLENKIEQRGNNYYLFKYGYLWGLCIRLLQDVNQRLPAIRPSKTRSAAPGTLCRPGSPVETT